MTLLRYTAYDLNNSLSVAAVILDYSSGSPVTVETLAMPPAGINGSYVLPFSAPPGKTYFANMMVYTDDTFETPNPLYTPGDTEINGTSNSGGGAGSCGNVVGFVNNPTNLIGFVNCDCE